MIVISYIKIKYLGELWPIKIFLNRFIVGRPNLIKMPIYITNHKIGAIDIIKAQFYYSVWLWAYTDKYPASIEIDALQIRPKLVYLMSELERDLPEGLYFHENHRRELEEPVVELLMNLEAIDADDNKRHPNDEIELNEIVSPELESLLKRKKKQVPGWKEILKENKVMMSEIEEDNSKNEENEVSKDSDDIEDIDDIDEVLPEGPDGPEKKIKKIMKYSRKF